jgi:hypothetical protein
MVALKVGAGVADVYRGRILPFMVMVAGSVSALPPDAEWPAGAPEFPTVVGAPAASIIAAS